MQGVAQRFISDINHRAWLTVIGLGWDKNMPELLKMALFRCQIGL
jgi:hypothetical protein